LLFPAGTNNIGDVDVLTLPTLPAGNNNIGDVDVATLPVAFNTGTRSATTQRVTIATDDVVPASQSGTWTVQPGNTANTTPWLVTTAGVVGGGRTPFTGSIAATLTLIKSSQAELGGWFIFNPNATTAYLQLFNAASTGAVTLGTTAPTLSLGIPAGGGANLASPNGIQFSSGIVIAATTTRAGSTGPASTVDYNLFVT
jgi:hypothetical protein